MRAELSPYWSQSLRGSCSFSVRYDWWIWFSLVWFGMVLLGLVWFNFAWLGIELYSYFEFGLVDWIFNINILTADHHLVHCDWAWGDLWPQGSCGLKRPGVWWLLVPPALFSATCNISRVCGHQLLQGWFGSSDLHTSLFLIHASLFLSCWCQDPSLWSPTLSHYNF